MLPCGVVRPRRRRIHDDEASVADCDVKDIFRLTFAIGPARRIGCPLPVADHVFELATELFHLGTERCVPLIELLAGFGNTRLVEVNTKLVERIQPEFQRGGGIVRIDLRGPLPQQRNRLRSRYLNERARAS